MNGKMALEAPLFADEDRSMMPNEEYDRYLDEVAADRLKEAGQKQALDNPITTVYAREAEAEIRRLIRYYDVTADDVTTTLGPPPNRYILGAVFSKLIKQGVIEPSGYVKSTRRSSHGRRVTSYRGRR